MSQVTTCKASAFKLGGTFTLAPAEVKGEEDTSAPSSRTLQAFAAGGRPQVATCGACSRQVATCRTDLSQAAACKVPTSAEVEDVLMVWKD